MNISLFSNPDLIIEATEGNIVSFRYMFQDFRGTAAVFTGWVGFIQTQCRRFQAIRGMVSAPDIELYRWVYELAPLDLDRSNAIWDNSSSRSKGYELCESVADLALGGVCGSEISVMGACDYVLTISLSPGLTGDPGERFNDTVLFNCSIYFVDSRTNNRPASSDVDTPVPPEVHLLGVDVYRHPKRSVGSSDAMW